MAPRGYRIGIDLGGTKIEGVALAPGGTIAVRRRVPTPRDDYAATLDAVAAWFTDIERELGAARPRSASGCPAPSLLRPVSSRTPTPPG